MNLSKILPLKRPLVVFDLETTGVDTRTARIVEIGFQMFYPKSEDRPVKEYRTLVNPGVPIPAETTEVHKISAESFAKCRDCGGLLPSSACPQHETSACRPWPTFKDLALNLAKGFTDVDLAGKNVKRFDLPILVAEFGRVGVLWSPLGARIIDVERIEQIAVPRTLSDLYEKYTGQKMDDAHQALADVRGTTTVLEHQLQQHQTRLPRDLDALHALQWPGMIDLEGKFRFNDDGVPCFSSWGKYSGQPMRNADTGYWDFILGKDFAAETKAIAANAKLGVFPCR